MNRYRKILPNIARPVITYSTDIARHTDWYAHTIAYAEETRFDLYRGGVQVVSLTTPLLGRHNIENIVGVSALLLEKNLLTPEELQKRIARPLRVFNADWTKRPLRSSVLLYEGFGSSHGKARSALDAMNMHISLTAVCSSFLSHIHSRGGGKSMNSTIADSLMVRQRYMSILTLSPLRKMTRLWMATRYSLLCKNGGADAVRLHNDLTPLTRTKYSQMMSSSPSPRATWVVCCQPLCKP